MRKDILISTTSSLQNINIEQYIDTISTNVVIGANFFSDFKASFTDLFGGFSDSYQSKLDELYKVAIDNLKHKASYIGANAIIGLKVDFGEISGKDKSMFMVSIVGTAVKISDCKGSVSNQAITNVSSSDLANEIIKYNVLQLLKNDKAPLLGHWQYLFTNSNDEITTLLLDLYLPSCEYVETLPPNMKLLYDNIGQYFKRVDTDAAIKALYLKIVDYKQPIIKILKETLLLSPKEVIHLIKDGKLSTAISCLSIDKEFYTAEDLAQMTEIVELFDNLPDTGEIKMVKGGMLSKDKDKYVCSAGHSSDTDNKYCGICGVNIKGLTRDHETKINVFKIKVDALKSLFNTK